MVPVGMGLTTFPGRLAGLGMGLGSNPADVLVQAMERGGLDGNRASGAGSIIDGIRPRYQPTRSMDAAAEGAGRLRCAITARQSRRRHSIARGADRWL